MVLLPSRVEDFLTVEDASVSSREAPLALSGPRRVCVRESGLLSPLPFAAFVRSLEEWKEGQQRQEKKTGRGRNLPRREARLFA